MSSIDLANPSPIEGRVKHIDIKQAAIQMQPVEPTLILTPASTPEEEKFTDDLDAMAGKKVFSLEKPDDRARELAAKLTLDEQVCLLFLISKPPQSEDSCCSMHLQCHSHRTSDQGLFLYDYLFTTSCFLMKIALQVIQEEYLSQYTFSS
ncbi:hypothetical protein BDV95DRAFT_98517 [Massariosphaeria phaeospora]|uniref:Uncharacterized protein n=1 Tax=Massariosphaeria phaeospora TaxID=100035 RepID=A0A7C8I2U6_9PLEO|nr:hypothetical protein BDV95DRAFT_98517 [Massariosphaeria phaeospora]